MKLSDRLNIWFDSHDFINEKIFKQEFLPKVEQLENILNEILQDGTCIRYNDLCKEKCRFNFDNKTCLTIKAKELC